MTRESTKARVQKYLGMMCDSYYQILANNNADIPQDVKNREDLDRIVHTIYVLCEILKVPHEQYHWLSYVAKWRPDFWQKDIYDKHRRYVKA